MKHGCGNRAKVFGRWQWLSVIAALAVAPVGIGCFSDTVPATSEVFCLDSGDCPQGWFCVQALQRCIPADRVDEDGPTITTSREPTPALAKAGTLVELSLASNEPLVDATLIAEHDAGGLDLHFRSTIGSDGRDIVSDYLVEGDEAVGNYVLTATATDRQGNASTYPVGLITLDFKAPMVTDIVVIDDTVGVDGQVSFEVSTLADDTESATARLTPADDEPLIAVDAAINGHKVAISYQPDGSDEGEYTLELQLSDAAGNMSAWQTIGDVVLDFQRPELNMLIDGQPVDEAQAAYIRPGQTASVRVHSNEPLSTPPVVSAIDDDDDSSVLELVDETQTSFEYRFVASTTLHDVIDLAIGEASDRAGNSAEHTVLSSAIVVDGVAADVVSFSGATDGQRFAAGASIELSLQISEPVSELPVVVVGELSFDVEPAQGESVDSDEPLYLATTTVPASASIVAPIVVVLHDRAGNSSSATGPVIVVDGIAPALIHAEISVPIVSADGSTTFSLTTNEALSSAPQLRWSHEGVLLDTGLPGFVGLTEADGLGSSSWSWLLSVDDNTADGEYALSTIQLLDLAGNSVIVTSSDTTFRVDSIGPGVEEVERQDGDRQRYGLDDQLALLITPTEALVASPVVTIGDVTLDVSVEDPLNDDSGRYRYSAITTVSAGADIVDMLRVELIDDAGNKNIVDAGIFVFDGVLPEVQFVELSSHDASLGDSVTLSVSTSEPLAAEPTLMWTSGAQAVEALPFDVLTTVDENGTTTWSWLLTVDDEVVDGAFELDAVSMVDLAGNEKTTNLIESHALRIDNVAPSVLPEPTLDPPAGEAIALDDTLSVQLTATESLLLAELFIGPISIGPGELADDIATWEVPMSDHADLVGEMTLTVRLTDTAENIASVDIGSYDIDTAMPRLLVATVDDTIVTRPDTAYITLLASEPVCFDVDDLTWSRDISEALTLIDDDPCTTSRTFAFDSQLAPVEELQLRGVGFADGHGNAVVVDETHDSLPLTIEVVELPCQPGCLNGGVCAEGIDGWFCDCPAGLNGDQCQFNIDDCADVDCRNGGVCVDEIDGYHCECEALFAGDHCEDHTLGCPDHPCLHRGVCVEVDDSEQCECPETSFGPQCEVNRRFTAFSRSACVVDDGDAYCWGSNVWAELGLGHRDPIGDDEQPSEDAKVSLGAHHVVQISTGDAHTCAVTDVGALICWGRGYYGVLGNEALRNTKWYGDSPDEMGYNVVTAQLGEGRVVEQVVAGMSSTCAVFADHSVKCWGSNAYGTLGLEDNESRGDDLNELGDNLPEVNVGGPVAALTIGGRVTHWDAVCARLLDGNMKCWGAASAGSLGQGTTTSIGANEGDMGEGLPPIDLGTGRTALHHDHHAREVCVVRDDASVVCWGGLGNINGNGNDQIVGDNPEEMGDNLVPVMLGDGARAQNVAVGSGFGCALLEDGSVKCWGDNTYGQLGLGDTEARVEVDQLGEALPAVRLGGKADAVWAGKTMACALLEDGRLKCWGRNLYGELGLGDLHDRGGGVTTFVDAVGPVLSPTDGQSFTQIATFSNSVCILDDAGTVRCWGANDRGQLGLRDENPRGTTSENRPSMNDIVDLGTAVIADRIGGGGATVCAVVDGEVKCWGANAFGQLGQGDFDDHGSAASHMGDALSTIAFGGDDVVEDVCVSAGDVETSHLCARMQSGSVKCWGYNDVGQLGVAAGAPIGDNVDEMGDVLMAVTLDGAASHISCGGNFTCAIVASEAYCWGADDDGQLGSAVDGLQSHEPRRVILPADIEVIELAAGRRHACVLTAAGAVYCWGANGSGQLGIGHANIVDDNADARVTVDFGERTAKRVAAGADSSCAILDDDTLRCWGDNATGQLGLGSTTNLGATAETAAIGDAITSATGSAVVDDVAVGDGFVCALVRDKGPSCWGSNDDGQLGLGDSEARMTTADYEMGASLRPTWVFE